MILLISNPLDTSSSLVSRWLEYLGASFLFLSEENIYKDCSLDITTGRLRLGNQIYALSEFKSVWIRRPFSFHLSNIYEHVQNDIDVDLGIVLREEVSTITRYLYSYFKEHSNYFLANPSWYGTNKLKELETAQNIGLQIPKTLVTTRKSEVDTFLKKHGKIISKSLYNSRVIYPWDIPYRMYTSRVSPSALEALPDSFAPSLLQAEVIREYDIRVFYLDGTVFAMAILPENQCDEVDYRKLDTTMLRTLPIRLDDEIRMKIGEVMKKMELKIGSLDLIKGIDGQIYFIEVNHEGQFNMIDEPCNYGIHQLIAEKLIQHDKL